MRTGDRLNLFIEKPVAGGRMIARHADGVVLVAGAVPGEVVEAEVERVHRGTGWARTMRVLEASPDRVDDGDWACGGNVLAHIAYSRQLTLKREIIEDAFRRIGRMSLPGDIVVEPSPATGYRMRARLHVVDGRIGFFREGTHTLCDAAATSQLLPESVELLRALEPALRVSANGVVEAIELAENRDADERAVHLTLRENGKRSDLASMNPLAGLQGISCSVANRPHVRVLWGHPEVTDTFALPSTSGAKEFTLTRQAHAFFQGNRYLLLPLIHSVLERVTGPRVLELYAGVGLFSVAMAAWGGHEVIAVEGDRTAARDLERNASRVSGVEAHHQSVEAYLARGGPLRTGVVVVDPPRTGLTKEAVAGVLGLRPARVVYVSCDVATLARDTRLIVDHGYELTSAHAFDLFPNTAHVESLLTFDSATQSGG